MLRSLCTTVEHSCPANRAVYRLVVAFLWYIPIRSGFLFGEAKRREEKDEAYRKATIA
jgi:hypothetical protein